MSDHREGIGIPLGAGQYSTFDIRGTDIINLSAKVRREARSRAAADWAGRTGASC